MSEAPPAQPLSSAEPRGTSRRWFLAGGAAIVLGGGGGAIAELLSSQDGAGTPPPPRPPQALLAAATAERALIADLDATTGGTPATRRVIVAARADHAAHLRALEALLSRFRPAPAARRRHRGTPRTSAQLRAAEERAAHAAADRGAEMGGGYAALLASIAACEASHAELLR